MVTSMPCSSTSTRLARSNGTRRRSSARVAVGDVFDSQGRGDLAGDLVQELGLALALLELAVHLGVVDGDRRLVGEGPRELALLGGEVPLGRRSRSGRAGP